MLEDGNGGEDTERVRFSNLGGDRIDRRTALKLFSAAGLTGLAGCSGNSPAQETTSGDDSGGNGSNGGDDGNAGDGNAASGGTLKIGELQGNVKTLDPQLCSTAVCYRLIEYIHSGLVDINESFEIVPGLAENWETPDDTTVVFNIRDNAVWHNGESFTADDWVYTLDRIRSDDFDSLYEGELDPVESATAEDDTTLRIDLSQPYAPLFAYLTPVGRAGIPVNQTAVEEEGNQNYGNNPVGTGPFKLDQWENRQNLQLSAFDDYWGDAPNVDGIQVDLIEDQNALVNALLSGSIHIAPNLPTAQVQALKGSNQVNLHEQLTGNYHYISMNTNSEPLDDVKVRQAFMLAINRQAAVDAIFQGLAVPNTYPMSPAFEWAVPEEDSFQRHDPERAKELLEEAGHPDGIEVEFLVPNLEPWRSAGEWLSQELTKANIETDMQVMEWAAFRDRTASEPFEYDIFNLQWIGDIDPDQEVSMFHKDSGLNRMYYEDDTATRLVEEQRQALDQNERSEILKELLKHVAEVGPYAVFATQRGVYGVRKEVQGFKTHPAMYINAAEISLSQ